MENTSSPKNFLNYFLHIGPRGMYFDVSAARHWQDEACTIAALPGDPVRVSVMPDGQRFEASGVFLSEDGKSLGGGTGV